MFQSRFAAFAIFILASSVVVWVGNSSSAADWPRYRGPDANGISPQSNGRIGGTDLFSTHWKSPTNLGFSSFSVADGKAFTLVIGMVDGKKREICLALDVETGDPVWQTPLGSGDYKQGGGDAGARGNRGGDGPRSTPTFNAGKVYVYDAFMGISCLDAKSGTVLWQRDIKKEFAGRNIAWRNAISPVIEGDQLFICGGGKGQSFIAFNKNDGSVNWKTGDEKMTHATPVVATIHGQRQVIFFMQSGLVSVDPTDGSELWRSAFPYRTSTAASPVVAGNLVYVSAGYSVGSGLYQINKDMTVTELWRKPNRLVNHWSTPLVYNGHLYGIFGFKRYGQAPLMCVELRTGEIKWQQKNYGPGNCILVGDKLVALSDRGEIAIVKATPKKYDELLREDIIDGKCWSMPSFSDGKIFIRSTKEGACVSVK